MRYDIEQRDWEMRRNMFIERQHLMMRMMRTTIVMVVVMFSVYFIAIPLKGILVRYEEKLAAETQGMKRIPSIQNEIASIEKRLAGITTESIASRISTIENSIKAGEIKPEDVATVQEINHELSVLKTYMFSDPQDLVELKTLQRDYNELHENQSTFVSKDVMDREISFLQNLFYASIALFSILLAVIGGSWFQSNRRIKQMDEKLTNNVSEPEVGADPEQCA